MATDYCERALQIALGQVKERISVTEATSGEGADVDVDELMKTYAHALQREINVTDLVSKIRYNLLYLLVNHVMSIIIIHISCE